MHAAPPQKKGCSTGCWIALAVVGGLFVIGGGIAGYVVWSIAQDPDVKKAIGVVSGGLGLIKDAQTAPGTSELKRMGCQEALVFDVEKLFDFAEEHNPEKGKFKRPQADIGALVLCQTPKKKLSCEDIAEAYVDAAEPDEEFAVTVSHTDAKRNCSERFDKNGKSLGSFASGSVPVPEIPSESGSGSDDD